MFWFNHNLIQKPSAFSFKDTMVIGTAGYTAMLCVMALQKHGIKNTFHPLPNHLVELHLFLSMLDVLIQSQHPKSRCLGG
jgi:hypothetical protein